MIGAGVSLPENAVDSHFTENLEQLRTHITFFSISNRKLFSIKKRVSSLPEHASEQGNVIGLVSVYIYPKKNCN